MVYLNKEDIKSMYMEEIEKDFLASGYKRYNALQVYVWLSRGVREFIQMTDISKQLREDLAQKYQILSVQIVKKLASSLDETVKYLFRLHDGELIEAVLMKYHHGYTICISTQVGCKMDCAFCATGKGGFTRNLSASEMLAQIQAIQEDMHLRISNVVLMGMGEPLDNYSNTLRFIKLVTSQNGMNIGMRHISISTCGIIDKINSLATENLGATLSVSLHAPNDQLRNQIMPINRKFPVGKLLLACKNYMHITKRRVTYEYAMIKDLNDGELCARELASKIKGSLCHVNLIPVNNIKEGEFTKSHHGKIESFCRILQNSGISVTTRRSLGGDIEASCGQLRTQNSADSAL